MWRFQMPNVAHMQHHHSRGHQSKPRFKSLWTCRSFGCGAHSRVIRFINVLYLNQRLHTEALRAYQGGL